MKFIYLSFVFTFIVQICSAQLGYFGKRNAVKLDGYFCPAFRAKDINSNNEFVGLATTANLNAMRIISDKHALSLEYNYFKDYMSSSDDYGLQLVRFVRQNSIGISYTKFRKTWIAPIGTYWKYSLMINKNDVSEQKDFVQRATWFSIKLGISFGYQRVISDRFLIDLGLTSYLDMGLFGIATNKDDEMIGFSAPDLILSREMLRFKIGFGYLF